jgi:hypothetical protein
MKITSHTPFFEHEINKYRDNMVPNVNPFRDWLNRGALWLFLESYNSDQRQVEDGMFDLQNRLSAYGLSLGDKTHYPKPTGMVARALLGADGNWAIGVAPSEQGLDLILVKKGANLGSAMERWSLPLGEGLNSVDAAINEIVAEIDEIVCPRPGLVQKPSI